MCILCVFVRFCFGVRGELKRRRQPSLAGGPFCVTPGPFSFTPGTLCFTPAPPPTPPPRCLLFYPQDHACSAVSSLLNNTVWQRPRRHASQAIYGQDLGITVTISSSYHHRHHDQCLCTKRVAVPIYTRGSQGRGGKGGRRSDERNYGYGLPTTYPSSPLSPSSLLAAQLK